MFAYRNLQESKLAQLIILNRRRAGEGQRIRLETYINAHSEVPQEEIEQSLSPVEKELTKNFKRIVIRGKRGRGVPVLFTSHVQKLLKYIMKIRPIIEFIQNENLLFFPVISYSHLIVQWEHQILLENSVTNVVPRIHTILHQLGWENTWQQSRKYWIYQMQIWNNWQLSWVTRKMYKTICIDCRREHFR